MPYYRVGIVPDGTWHQAATGDRHPQTQELKPHRGCQTCRTKLTPAPGLLTALNPAGHTHRFNLGPHGQVRSRERTIQRGEREKARSNR